MPPKNKKGGAKGKAADDDDDWEAILAVEAAKNATEAPPVVPPPVPDEGEKNGGDDDDDDDDEEDDAKDAKGKDKKKKKKKTKKEKEAAAAEKKPSQLSAQARAILEAKQRREEEEARIKKLQEEEELRIKAEEEAEAARLKAIEDEKERKRLSKQAKVEAQKASGTYMTKTEKEKARLAQQRIEAMKAAGMLNVPALTSPKTDGEKPAASPKKKPVQKQEEVKEVIPEPVVVEAPPVDDDDDWESAVDNDKPIEGLAQQINQIKLGAVEDTITLEKEAEQKKLNKLGIERAERERIAALKKEEEERARDEMERRELEAILRKENSRKRRVARDEAAMAARSADNLRSPICCIMGHVDTGKTKLLDKIRHTNVQEGEAGGITQQIGATQFPKETLALQTQAMQKSLPFDIKLPGLLVIDTPGHESFTNLRSRGSSLCDIAILVIDLMHGLEQQTIESIKMLKASKRPFVVALNKIDRCYGWKTMPDSPVQDALAAQDENCKLEFKDRSERIIVQLMEQGLNSQLYWKNDDLANTVCLCPTSAISGEGVPDILRMIIVLTQERLYKSIMYTEVLQCTVLEVKVIDGLGTTIDVVLVNGTLKEGDTIVVSSLEGPIVTEIRALLTPPPNREMRIKSEYIHHKELKGAIGVKIVAKEIERAIAGTPLLVVEPEDDLEDVKEDCQSDLTKVMKALATDSRGVMVHASTLGALEALLQFLREECKPPIPVSHINIGPIYKKDVMRANINNEKGHPEFATILAFDTRIDSEAAIMAEELKVRIFSAEIIYHLFDQFTAFMRGLTEARRAEAEAIAVHPCVLKILPSHVFNKKDPIVLGVEVIDGTLKLGTPLCVPQLNLDVGKVISIQNNHKEATQAKKGMNVAIKISNESNPTLTYGRQFDHTHSLYSKLTRPSIDALKEFFKDEVSKEDWLLVVKLKKVFDIK